VVKHVFIQWKGPSASESTRALADAQLEAAKSAASEASGGDVEILDVSRLEDFNLEEVCREIRAPSKSVTGSLNRIISDGIGVDLSRAISGTVGISAEAAVQGLAEEQLEGEEPENNGDEENVTDVVNDPQDEELDVRTAVAEVRSANGMWDWVLLQCGGEPGKVEAPVAVAFLREEE